MPKKAEHGRGRLALLAGTALLALSGPPAAAQESLTAVVLRGRAMAGQGAASGATVLAPGLRIESPAGTWTETAHSTTG